MSEILLLENFGQGKEEKTKKTRKKNNRPQKLIVNSRKDIQRYLLNSLGSYHFPW
jgi:hypothetical protein